MAKKNRSFISCLAYIGLVQIYNLQGVLGLSLIGKWIAVLIIVFSLYKSIYVITHYKFDAFLKAITGLLLLFTVYGIHYIFWGPQYIITTFGEHIIVSKFDYLKNIWLSILPLYVIYSYALKGVLNPNRFLWISIFLIGCSILAFVSFYFGIDNTGSFDLQDNLTNNQGYKFVMLIVLLYLAPKWRIQLMILCIIFIFLSLKRGAILMGSIAFIVGLVISLKQAKGIHKFGVFMLIGLIMLIGSNFIITYYENSPSFQRRIEATIEGDTSGRSDIVEVLICYFENKSTLETCLFGEGADATIGIAGNYAHNDWIEILINQGALGILLFSAVFLSWYATWRKLKYFTPKHVWYSFGMALLIFFLKSIFSMAYTGLGVTTALVVSYAYYVALHNRYESKKRIS